MSVPKVLVSDPWNHDELLDFMSVYQTQNEKGIHYHPEGALCWYTCNQYGDPTGVTVFARRVPIKKYMWNFEAKKKFRTAGFFKKVPFKNLFLSERNGYEELKTVKPRLATSGNKTKKGKRKWQQKKRPNQKKNSCIKT